MDLNRRGLNQYENHSFDIVISCDVIEHLENPSSLIREINRILKVKGQLFITVPNCANIFQRLYFLKNGNTKRYRPHIHGSHGHISMLPNWIFEYLVGEFFTIDKIDGDGFVVGGVFVSFLPKTRFWSYTIFYKLTKKQGNIADA